MNSGTYTRPTCALCWNEGIYNETFLGTYGLCTHHLREWSISGTYREVTSTGTYLLPEWLRGFIAYHNNDERRMYHKEITFSDLEEEKPTREI